MTDLADWLEEGYPASFRTACLILGNRDDAEEAVQEAFLRAWRFRASLGGEANHRAWLYRVVVNSCCSKLRQEVPHRERRSSSSLLDGMASPTRSPDEELWRTQLAREVPKALQALPWHLRVPIVLRYYAELSEREIAIAIGRRPGTVKSRLHEARRLLAANPAIRAMQAEFPAHDNQVSDEVLR